MAKKVVRAFVGDESQFFKSVELSQIYKGKEKAWTSDPEYVTVLAKSTDENKGHVNGSRVYKVGSNVSLNAIPKEGYYLEKWSDETSDNPKEFVAEKDVRLSATFTDEALGRIVFFNTPAVPFDVTKRN